jgi:hypothetical protein
MKERVYATYWMETGEEPSRAAEIIAGEQSSGTFVVLPKETPELKERFGARIERLEVIDTSSLPSLPTPQQSSKYSRCSLTLSWPIENMGTCLPTLMATVAGNLFELKAVSGLRITDLQLPDSFALAYPGPQFGIEGTRKLAGVARGPLIGTIIKPSVGLSASETADAKSTVAGTGGGSGTDGSAGSGSGSGGGVGSGVGTGKGTSVGPGTGGGPGTVYPPAPTELFLPPLPVPNKAKGTVIVVFEVDSTGKVLDLQFTPTKDGAYNRKLREALVAIRFRPAVNAQGVPVRGKAEITYSL